MALLFMDSFEGYSDASVPSRGKNAIVKMAPTNAPISTLQAKHGSQSLQFINSTSNFVWYVLNSASASTVFINCYLYVTNITSVDRHLFSLLADVTQCGFWTNTSGYIKAVRGFNTTTLGTTSVVVPMNTWVLFEAKVVISDTVGVIIVKFDGATVLNLSGIDTKASTTTSTVSLVGSGSFSGSSSTYIGHIDDLVIFSNSGDAPNDWIGAHKIEVIRPDGAGSSAQWTPSTGSNYACVDETLVDPADYVSEDTAGQIDLYTFGNIASEPETIHALQVCIDSQAQSGTHTMRRVCRQASTNYTGDTFAPPVTARIVDSVMATDPATGVAWTKTGIGTVEFGFELVA